VGLSEERGRLEGRAVELECLIDKTGTEVVREGIGQAEDSGQLCAEQRRTEKPDLGKVPVTGHGTGMTRGVVALGEVTDQLDDVVWEMVGAEIRPAPQRPCRPQVGAGGASEPEVDSSRVECLEGAELFGDHQGRVIGKHHSARADPDDRGGGGDVSDQHRWS